METQKRVEQIAGIVALVLWIIGCFLVLRPFLSAVMWAAILCFSTWPLYSRIERMVRGRRSLAATIMTLLVALVLVLPFVVVGISLTDNAKRLYDETRRMLAEGLPDPPHWLSRIPVVGNTIEERWERMAHNREEVVKELKSIAATTEDWVVQKSKALGVGVIQLSLSVFIAFFFYRDGVAVVTKLQEAAKKVIGDRTQNVLELVGGTVKGVVYGILGTALAQGILAGLGFWIAGVPGPHLLGLLTFFMSLVPMGPPLVWIPATIWLFAGGSIGWGIFMAIWGLLVISSVDNFLKPYLISRGSSMPFALVFLGVLGGVIAFGFIGIFLGPTLLAVGYSLLHQWTAEKKEPERASAQPVQAAAKA